MLRLSNIRIPVRIALACLLPLLAFIGFAGKELLQKRSDYSSAAQIAELADATPSITALVHELQKERGSSMGFFTAKGQAFGDALRAQRPAVDKALTAWQSRMTELAQRYPGSKLARDIDAAKTKLGSLASMRANIDSLGAKQQEAFDYYSATLSLLATAIDQIGELTDEAR